MQKVKSDFKNRNKAKITKVPFFRDTLYLFLSKENFTKQLFSWFALTRPPAPLSLLRMRYIKLSRNAWRKMMIENFSFVFVCLCWLCGVGYILIPQCSVRTFLKWCVPWILLCQLCVGKVRNRWLTSEVKWLLACLLLPEKARRRGQMLELENLPVTLLNWIFHQIKSDPC